VGTLALDVHPQETVYEFKKRLSERSTRLGFPEHMSLTYAGKLLPDEQYVMDTPSLLPWTTLQLSHRLRGGGGDGGSTGAESRSCYLEMYAGKKNDKVNPVEELLARWTRCHLTGETLTPPVVIDEVGTLFNKDAIVNALLNKSIPPQFSYISSLKHVIELKLERNPRHGKPQSAASHGSNGPSNDSPFCCPVTGVEFNGRYKFVTFRPTGHTVSEKAIKDAPAVVQELFGRKWSSEELLPVNPTGEQADSLRAKAAARVAAEKEKKRSKKEAKEKSKAGAETTGATGADAGEGTSGRDQDAGHQNGGGRATSPGPGGATVAGQKRGVSPTADGNGVSAPAVAAAAAAAAAASNMPPPPKRSKGTALEAMPKNSTPQVFASLFKSSLKEPEKETYLCRNTSARGMHLT